MCTCVFGVLSSVKANVHACENGELGRQRKHFLMNLHKGIFTSKGQHALARKTDSPINVLLRTRRNPYYDHRRTPSGRPSEYRNQILRAIRRRMPRPSFVIPLIAIAGKIIVPTLRIPPIRRLRVNVIRLRRISSTRSGA